MNLQKLIIQFLTDFPGIYTLTDLAMALNRKPNTNMRHALDVLVASRQVQRVPVASDSNRLAWGYTTNQLTLPE